MRLCRYKAGDFVGYGLLVEDAIQPFEGDLFGQHQPTGGSIPLADVQLLAPLVPGTILAAAVNYKSHLASGRAVLKDDDAPDIPQFFLKPASSVIDRKSVV